jgi:hypothetical protein
VVAGGEGDLCFGDKVDEAVLIVDPPGTSPGRWSLSGSGFPMPVTGSRLTVSVSLLIRAGILWSVLGQDVQSSWPDLRMQASPGSKGVCRVGTGEVLLGYVSPVEGVCRRP